MAQGVEQPEQGAVIDEMRSAAVAKGIEQERAVARRVPLGRRLPRTARKPYRSAPPRLGLLLGSTWSWFLAALRLREPIAARILDHSGAAPAAHRAAPQWWLTPANHS